jgi:hypothetical protein
MKLPFTSGDRGVQGNFDKLAGQLGFERVRTGVVTVTFTASALSATATVLHGLGVVPKLVIVQNWNITGVADGTSHTDRALWTATQFTVFSRASAAITQSPTVTWIAAA